VDQSTVEAKLKLMTRDTAGILEWSGDDALTARDFGAPLDEAWRVKQRLSGAISGETTAGLYVEVMASGACGGKRLGAGGGGFMLFLVHPDNQGAFLQQFCRMHSAG
jgi:D-glycero-alpha-D-manno-heptose-7-phosphate kinase